MKTSPYDVSNRELLQEFHKVADKVDKMDSRFDSMDCRFDSMDTRLGSMDSRFDSMDTRLDSVEILQKEILEAVQEHSSETDARFMLVESRLTRVEARMVTKDYLDDKLADQHAKIIEHMDRRIEKALN